MKNTRVRNEQGVVPMVAIIIGIFVLFGAAAAVYYVQSNQTEIEIAVDESNAEVAAEAQADGYPSMWVEAGLPQYPGGVLTKTRQGNNLVDGVSVSVETSDIPETVKAYYDSEMTTRGFTIQDLPGNEFVSMATYRSGDKQLSMQAVENGDTGAIEIKLSYHE